MTIMKKTLIIVATILMSVNVHAQTRRGSTAAPFLTVGMGATGSALGHAYTASATGAESMFWNPAGIARNTTNGSGGSLFLSYFDWFADISMYSSGVAFPVSGNGVLGINIGFVDYGRMEITTEDIPEGTGNTFGAYDMSFGISYASKLTQNFHFGGTVKMVRQSIWDMSAQTLAIDLGFILETEYLNGMLLGASISNFGGKMHMTGINTEVFTDIDQTSEGNNPDIPANIKTDRWDLPLSFKFGMAVPAVKTEYITLNLMSDIQQTNDNDLNLDLGTQFMFSTKTVNFSLNAGYKDFLLEDNVDSHFTYGAGIRLRTSRTVNVGFEFAQVPFLYLGTTRMIDFKVYF